MTRTIEELRAAVDAAPPLGAIQMSADEMKLWFAASRVDAPQKEAASHNPEMPTADEIARVEAWQTRTAFQRANEKLERLCGTEPLYYLGEVLDERFTKRALIGYATELLRRR